MTFFYIQTRKKNAYYLFFMEAINIQISTEQDWKSSLRPRDNQVLILQILKWKSFLSSLITVNPLLEAALK